MSQRYSYLSKKKSELVVVFSNSGLFLVFISKRVRTKMLKDNKVFIGRVRAAQKDYDDAYRLELIREWWESIDDTQLFERISNTPKGKVVLVNFDNKLFVNFNEVKSTELVSKMFLGEEEIPQYDD